MRYSLITVVTCVLAACGGDSPPDHDRNDSGGMQADSSRDRGGRDGGTAGSGGSSMDSAVAAGPDAGGGARADAGQDVELDASADAPVEPACSPLETPAELLLPPDGKLPCDLLPPEP
jgi:hypothetical protein